MSAAIKTCNISCEPITISQCTLQPYSNTGFPNFFNQTSQTNADEIAGNIDVAKSAGCFEYSREFLCGLLLPECREHKGLVFPKRQMCKDFYKGCGELLKVLKNAEKLIYDCDVYFSENPKPICPGQSLEPTTAYPFVPTPKKTSTIHPFVPTTKKTSTTHVFVPTTKKTSTTHVFVPTTKKTSTTHSFVPITKKTSTTYPFVPTTEEATTTHPFVPTTKEVSTVQIIVPTTMEATTTHPFVPTITEVAATYSFVPTTEVVTATFSSVPENVILSDLPKV